MDVIPQATPLYATVESEDLVFSVVGWRHDPSYDVWVHILTPLDSPYSSAETPARSVTNHPTLQAAQEALMRRD